MASDSPAPEEPWLLYDGDCPFCSRYVKWVRLQENLPGLRLVNARHGGAELELVRAAELDVNEGMVLAINGELHHGDRCIHAIAVMSTPVSPFNRINRWIFSSAALSRMIYPLLRTGRTVALILSGRSKIT